MTTDLIARLREWTTEFSFDVIDEAANALEAAALREKELLDLNWKQGSALIQRDVALEAKERENAELKQQLSDKHAECVAFYEEAERVIKQRDSLAEQVKTLRDALLFVKFHAVSLADAKVAALEALATGGK